MSAAAATETASAAADAAPVKGSKKKLIIIAAAVTVLLAGGGGAAAFMMKKRAAAAAAAAAEEDGAAEQAAAKPVKADVKSAPTFVPLDPFTVNLADRDAERYAQVGITLELADPKAGDLLKAYMPAIRNNILLSLGSKTAAQITDLEGKRRLAAEIRREALRPLGYEVALPGADAADAADAKPKKAAAAESEEAPIRAVHFSNFIVQ
jgi:flagellar FliL protein